MPLALLIPLLVTFGLNRALPAVWHRIADHATKAQIEQAADLCKNHNDCEAQKLQALQGMKPVTRIAPHLAPEDPAMVPAEQ